MTTPVDVAVAALRRARVHLAGLLTSQPKLAEHLGNILTALIEAEEALQGPEANRIDERETPPARRATGRKPKRYERDTRAGEDHLAEYRADSPYPFRVPKGVLDVVVDLLEQAADPLRFEKLRTMLGKRLGDTPAEYQLHVCLRFLQAGSLIRARRRTYAPADPKTFRRQAAALWRGTPAADRTV